MSFLNLFKKDNRADSTKSKIYPEFHITQIIESPTSYSSILNKLEQIVDGIAHRSLECEINVLVQIHKLSNDRSRICFGIDDFPFDTFNITFGEEFNVSDRFVKYETDYATRFVSLEDCKQELLLQFNWSDHPIDITEMTLLDHGDYVTNPLIIFRFTTIGNGLLLNRKGS